MLFALNTMRSNIRDQCLQTICIEFEGKACIANGLQMRKKQVNQRWVKTSATPFANRSENDTGRHDR